MSEQEAEPGPIRRGSAWPYAAVGFVLLALLVFILWGAPFLRDCYPEVEFLKMSPNEWGDLLAGLFGPAAFLFLAFGYSAQREDLRTQRDVLKLQREETRRLANEAERQSTLVGQQAERGELNGRIAEWKLIQDELRRLAPRILLLLGRHPSGEPIYELRERLPEYRKIKAEELVEHWRNGLSIPIDRQNVSEILFRFHDVYRHFEERLPDAGHLDRKFFSLTLEGQIAEEIGAVRRELEREKLTRVGE